MYPLLKRLGLVRLSDDSRARKAFILRILLGAIITLVGVGLLINLIGSALSPLDPTTASQNSLPAVMLAVILGFFVTLYWLSLRFSMAVSYVFVGLLLALAAYMGLRWGVDVTVAILFTILAIVMSGILISARASLITLAFAALAMIVIGNYQISGVLASDHYWRQQAWTNTDTIMTVIIFGIITTVSALSNWQTEHALARAIASEQALKEERDQLEITVERRTKELRVAEMERLSNVYRFAEFGRLSSGLFHNLANLITSLTLNMDSLQKSQSLADVKDAQEHLARAVNVNGKMREFFESVRRQLAGQRKQIIFSPADELPSIFEIVSHRAMQCDVTLNVASNDSTAKLHGDPAIFNQVVTNLVSNAIDAYRDIPSSDVRPRTVELNLTAFEKEVVVRVKDWGCGISDEVRDKVFEPFFTTKPPSHGTGIGLALAKRMVESDLGGTITVDSEEGKFTEFTISLPSAQ